MAASQFNSPAQLMTDGRIRVEGPQQFETASGLAPKVEYRFLLVQGGVVVKGSGEGWGSAQWFGFTDEGEESLRKGPVLAVGLAVSTSTEDPPGFTTFSWSEQIELVSE
jgi:hypothetical protein